MKRLMQDRRRLKARARLVAFAFARRAYVALARGRFARVLELELVQRVRRRLQHPMALCDVDEILGVLSAAGVHWWLFGGWGVDALIGRPTRRHKDLDVLVADTDLDVAVAALAARGFRPVPEHYPGAGRHVPGSPIPERELVQDAAARTVDLHPVDAERWPALIGVPDAYATGSLGDGLLPCVSPAAQWAVHQGFDLAAEHRANIRHIAALTATHGR